ncbi:MAG: alpha-2-macroglobulin [Deltaproteobacteria bacterium]|nr:alpha-2-macroglobulin [Deltaproteobacteria bacterium]
MKRRLILLVGLAVCFLWASPGHPARVTLFSPQGTVKDVRQVTARFSEPLAAFGDPFLEDPFIVDCAAKGRGRWMDDRNWVYDFEADLPAGLVCHFQIKPNWKSLAGTVLEGPQRFSFNTGGPSIRGSRPEEGAGRIDERQVFILSLDAEPEEASVLQQAYCAVEGIPERVGLRIIRGPEREKLFKELKYKEEGVATLVGQCRQTFPPEARVKIVWGRGIRSVGGIATTADQVIAFKTRPSFAAKLTGSKEKPKAGFIPLLPLKLFFTAPVAWEAAARITLKSPTGKIWQAQAEGRPGSFVERVVFAGPFPENQSLTLHLPNDLKDDSGRTLANRRQFPLTVKTDLYPALAKFPSRFGIVEAAAGGLLPLTVRNLEAEIKAWMTGPDRKPGAPEGAWTEKGTDPAVRKEGVERPAPTDAAAAAARDGAGPITGKVQQLGVQDERKIIDWLNILRTAKRKNSVFKGRDHFTRLTIPKTESPREFEVIGIPFQEPGFYALELESEILGSRLLAKPAPLYVPAGVLVTNLAAHFKWGGASSLVWVTTLDQGQPVKEAAVTIRDCTGRSLWQGKTDENGLAYVRTALPTEESLRRCPDKQELEEYTPALSGIRSGLFVFARAGGDLTLTHSSWNQGIEPWRFNLPSDHSGEDRKLLAHTVFDRTLLRAGDQVHMKHLIRSRTPRGLALAADTGKWKEVILEHLGGHQAYTLPLKWRANGTSECVFKIPQQAKLGTYEVFLAAATDPSRPGSGRRLRSGSFRVEEFRVPLMKAVIQGPREPVIQAAEIEVDLAVSHLSGGGAARLPVTIRTDLQPRTVFFPDYEEIEFANGGVKAGLETFTSGELEEEGEAGAEGRRSGEKRKVLSTLEKTLDNEGGARVKLSEIPAVTSPQDLGIELEFRDPNGEVQTAASRIPLYPSGLLAGIQAGTREPSRTALSYQVVILDLNGRPRPGTLVQTRLFERKFFSHRKRLAGGFYAYENLSEIVEAGAHCGGRTDERGVLYCEGPSAVAGSLLIQAEAADEKGRPSLAHWTAWIPGEEDAWFEAHNDDRIDLIPEKRQWEPGEKARFQVRLPFREATALITVEREGVLEAMVKKITRADPLVEIPVQEHYAPNVFVSALTVRGRIPETRPTATFDPGKPAYKLGLTEIRVGWRAHELRVEVRPEQATYKVRETAVARIKVQTASGAAPPRGSEAAVAVVDEGLLELKPNESWKLLEAMMKRAGCEVQTATAQMMVVGKRHFGRKARPQGGGGGRQFTRELFDTLLFWKGSVPLDENGEAIIRFPLNDSLTSFRIVAVVNSGEGLFGTGETAIRTTQDLMVLSGIPPLVREGDRFQAGFTLRNASSREMKVEAGLVVNAGKKREERQPVLETIPAGEARDTGWEMTAPLGLEKLEYEVWVREAAGQARDRIKVSQKVIPAVPVRTFQATLRRLEAPVRLELERPAGALPGRGGVRLMLRPKIAEGLGGVVEYFKRYPYSCLEQRVSKALVLGEPALWKSILEDLPAYLDEKGLAKYFPEMRQGSEIMTAYLLAISQEAGKEIPEPLKTSLLQGLKEFVEGRVIRQALPPAADLPLRKLTALEALSRYGQADPKTLGTLVIEPPRWPTSSVLDWMNILQRLPAVPDRSKKLKEAETVLRSRLNLQGTMLALATEKTDNLWWLMATPDTNAVRVLLTTLPLEGWQEDHPRLARGLLERMRRGHWDATLANAWGLQALEKFGARYEQVPVTGSTEAVIGRKTEAQDWAGKPAGREWLFPWPSGKETLELTHRGGGSPWATVQSLAAVPLTQPLSSGYGIRKTITPVEQKVKGVWSRGDVLRVRLDLEAQADRTWVVVNDPIPAGSRILGGGLAGDSNLLAEDEDRRGGAWETYRERSFEALRVYYQYVPKGKWSLEYTLRLNNEGAFYLPETRVEALYSPEMFGELPNPKMEVRK